MAKYIAKVPIGGNSFRYFYSAEEYGAYKAQKNKPAAAVKLKKSKIKKRSVVGKIPSGHVATASVGQVVSGYNGTGKPKNMSDEDWKEYNKLWSTANTMPKAKKKPKKTSLRTKLIYSFVRRNMAGKSKHSSGRF